MAKWAEGTSPYGDALIKIGYKRTIDGRKRVCGNSYGRLDHEYFLAPILDAIPWVSDTEFKTYETRNYEPLELGELHERSRD